MTKVIIEIKDKKDDTNACNVEIKMQGYEKGNDNEKGVTATVYNTVCKALKELNNISEEGR